MDFMNPHIPHRGEEFSTAVAVVAMLAIFGLQIGFSLQQDAPIDLGGVRNIAYGYGSSSVAASSTAPSSAASSSRSSSAAPSSAAASSVSVNLCGNGVLNAGEQCEPPGTGTCDLTCRNRITIGGGSASSSVAASVRSKSTKCGNFVVDPGEQCDNGRWNGLAPDCNAYCEKMFCLNQVVEPPMGEECEPVAEDASRTCGAPTCTLPTCDAKGKCSGGCKLKILQPCASSSVARSSSARSSRSASSSSAQSAQPSSSVEAEASSAQESSADASSSEEPPAEPPASSSEGEVLHEAAQEERRCGDGIVTEGEECDDANDRDDDGCSAACAAVPLPRCGDGILQETRGEQCDAPDGNSDTLPDRCRGNCSLPRCGDKVIDDGEECDDGNDIDGDGCNAKCFRATCGNGALEGGEECDQGSRNSDVLPDACTRSCQIPRCGNGIVDRAFGELCDDGIGNGKNGICRIDCVPGQCGDGRRDRGEACDDGNAMDGDGCGRTCAIEPVCPDGGCVPEPDFLYVLLLLALDLVLLAHLYVRVSRFGRDGASR